MTEEQLTTIINQQAVVIEAQKQLLISKTEEYLKAKASYGKYWLKEDYFIKLEEENQEFKKEKYKLHNVPSKAAVVISVITTLFNIYWVFFH